MGTTPRPNQHPLIKGAKELFETGRLSYASDYLKPLKKVSRSGCHKNRPGKGYRSPTGLFMLLEDKGYRVVLAPNGEQFYRAEVDEHEEPEKNREYNNLWRPRRCTVVYIGTVAIGLTIIEMSEEVEVRYVNG